MGYINITEQAVDRGAIGCSRSGVCYVYDSYRCTQSGTATSPSKAFPGSVVRYGCAMEQPGGLHIDPCE